MIDWKKEVESRRTEFLNDLSEWIKIPSVTHAPEAIEALKHGLALGEKFGFKSESFDNDRSGHIKFGSDDEFLGVLGHVDVVPVEAAEWDRDPFSGDIDDEYIYGRGTQDDKGPTLAALYALKIIKDLELPVSKGVRIIMGTQEEGGVWTDIEEYFKINPFPFAGFTPDADFPLIYAEKNILRMEASKNVSFKHVTKVKVGTVVNSVPGEAIIETNWSEAELKTLIEEFVKENKCTYVQEGSKLIFKGVATHSMKCFEGESALWHLIKFLEKNDANELTKMLNDIFVGDWYAEKLGAKFDCKEEGPTTCNVGLLDWDGSEASIKFDLRIPNAGDVEATIKAFEKTIPDFKPNKLTHSKGLFVSKEDPLIKTLSKAYKDVTKRDDKLLTTGGGTYAKVMPNCVAFGPLFPEDERRLHQKNERAHIANMLLAIEVYCEAIYNLIK